MERWKIKARTNFPNLSIQTYKPVINLLLVDMKNQYREKPFSSKFDLHLTAGRLEQVLRS